jgi:hypothetical protein
MSEQRIIDTWGRLEVEWREALESAMGLQREYDTKMTNHLVYHFAAPHPDELAEIAGLWRLAAEKRRAADDFIRQHGSPAE